MRVGDVMSRELVTVEPATPVGEAVALMSQRKVGSVLISLDGRLDGIFTERDVVRAVSHSADATGDAVEAWMSPRPTSVEADLSIGQALDLMLQSGFRHLPVTEAGRLAGMVSMRDLSRALAKKPQPA